MARNWREVRDEAVASGRIDPQRVDGARQAAEDLVHTRRSVDEQPIAPANTKKKTP